MSDSSAPPVRNWKRISLIACGMLGLCTFAFWLASDQWPAVRREISALEI